MINLQKMINDNNNKNDAYHNNSHIGIRRENYVSFHAITLAEESHYYTGVISFYKLAHP